MSVIESTIVDGHEEDSVSDGGKWFGKKIIFTHNTTKYLHLHYREFLARFVNSGAEVVVVAPADDAVKALEEIGVRCIDLTVSRRGLNPIMETRTLVQFFRIFSREVPYAVFSYSIKPVIYASIAARWCGVRNVFSMITGLGHLFVDQTVKYKAIRTLVLPLYRIATRYNSVVFFQNPDDKELFRDYRLVNGNKGVVTNGTGIDLETFHPRRRRSSTTVFIIISRLLWSKGFKEYVEAARAVKSTHPDVEFHIVGMYDDNPTSITPEQIDEWQKEGVISYLGATADVRPFLWDASVFVLPTVYREGLPRAVVEAMAVGKPVITTDTPGCRQTVVNGENGYLVPVEDAQSLADAMRRFVLEPELIQRMGHKSRLVAEARYDVHRINADIELAMNASLVDQ